MSASPDEKIRDRFLAWQCRLRQIAMREQGGRPSGGMCPQVVLDGGEVLSPGLTMLIVPKDPEESTGFLRFQAQKSHDPAQINEKGLQFLQGSHFQQARSFSDELTALFGERSTLAAKLAKKGDCLLAFEQFNQRYKMFCKVKALDQDDQEWQATYWHNRVFNPHLPMSSIVLAFKPDWASAQADPAPK